MPGNSVKQARPTILIADDHRATRHMIRSIFDKDGINVLEAENGRTALDIFISSLPDIVLLDIIMPGMDGLETCARLKKMPGGDQVPVLIFTGQDEGEAAERAFQAGASDFVTKPINLAELRHRIRRLFYLRELEENRKAAEQNLKSSFEKMQALSQKILQAYEEERVRLARELHDEVGMALTTVKLDLQLLNKEISAFDNKFAQRLVSSVELVNNSLDIIRSKAATLRPPALDDLGLIAVVQNMLHELSRLSGIGAELITSGAVPQLSTEIETALYRCIQEALTNVARHSEAKNVVVKMIWNQNDACISITDNGIGFNGDTADISPVSMGLQGMKERVSLLSGELVIKTSPGNGTDIQIKIPFGHVKFS